MLEKKRKGRKEEKKQAATLLKKKRKGRKEKRQKKALKEREGIWPVCHASVLLRWPVLVGEYEEGGGGKGMSVSVSWCELGPLLPGV